MVRSGSRGLIRFRQPPLSWTACGILIAVGVVSTAAVMLGSWRPTMENTDFAQDYASAKAWNANVDPYGDTPTLVVRYVGKKIATWPYPYTNPHPPVQILTAEPFQLLPFRIANAIWTLLMAGAFSAAIWILFRQLGVSRLGSFTLAIGSLALPTVRFSLKNGEPNALALLLIVMAWSNLKRGRQGKAGAALGLAAALRVFPILLIVPLLRKRMTRAASYMLVTAASVSVASVLAFGHLGDFVHSVKDNEMYWRGAGHNISLISIPFRWLTPNPWFRHQTNLHAVATVLAIVLALACLAAMFATPARMSQDVLWAAVPWMILATPLAWADYLIIAIPCVALMLVRNKANAGRFVLTLIISTLILIGRPYYIFNVNPVSVATQVLGLALPMYGLLGLGLLEWLPSRKNAIGSAAHPIVFDPTGVTQDADR